jgi:hypothetical protein
MACKACAGCPILREDYRFRLECSLNGPFMRHSAQMGAPRHSHKEERCDKDAGANARDRRATRRLDWRRITQDRINAST